jgi:hypothetical protein
MDAASFPAMPADPAARSQFRFHEAARSRYRFNE